MDASRRTRQVNTSCFILGRKVKQPQAVSEPVRCPVVVVSSPALHCAVFPSECFDKRVAKCLVCLGSLGVRGAIPEHPTSSF